MQSGRDSVLRSAACLLGAGVIALAIASPGIAASTSDRLADNRERQNALADRIAETQDAEADTEANINRASKRIEALEKPLAELEADLRVREAELSLRRKKLARVTAQLERAQEKLERVKARLAFALDVLEERVVGAYVRGDATFATVILQAETLEGLLDRQQYVAMLAQSDSSLVDTVENLRNEADAQRDRARALRKEAKEARDKAREAAEEIRAARDEVAARQQELAAVRAEEQAQLGHLEHSREAMEAEMAALASAAAELQAMLQVSPVTYTGGSPGTLSWPVSGAVVSPFGPRWGRMHEGIDISAPAGTPIAAAADGAVAYAGWMSGYGNLVVIQHGGGLSTAYAHQSSIGVSVGQQVTRGMTIGAVGCTGHCFGDHLHFEVRLNGGAVNPMAYL